MGWDVPIVGQTTLGSGQTKALLEKPEYWDKVYPNNFRPVCYAQTASCRARTSEFVERLKKAKIDMGDTLLWWIALGYDGADDDRRGDEEHRHRAGTDRRLSEQGQGLPGIYGDITLTPEKHDGYPGQPDRDVSRPIRSRTARSIWRPATAA